MMNQYRIIPITFHWPHHSRVQLKHDICTMSTVPTNTITNFTRLTSIANRFMPTEFDKDSKDFCWQSHLNISSLPLVHESYSSHELAVSDIVRKIEIITNVSNPLNTTCFPSVHIIGFPKCGSTYLYKILSKHPELRAGREKEPHFWTKFPLNNQVHDTYSFLTYLANFIGKDDPLPTKIRKKVSIMDASQSTIWETERHDDLCAVPRFLKGIAPKSKFIVLMRNPVDQLYSDFWHFTLNCNNSNVSEEMKRSVMINQFFILVKQEIRRLEKCVAVRSLGDCIYYNILTANDALAGCKKIRFGINMYAIFIQRWLNFFNMGQFLFLRLEDMATRPYDVFIRVWKFLHVKLLDKNEFEEMVLATSRILSNYPSISQKVRIDLEEFYAPFNKELASLLNDTNFLWK